MDYGYFEDETEGLASKCNENEQDWAGGGEGEDIEGGEGEGNGGEEGKGDGEEGNVGAGKWGGEGKGWGGEKEWYEVEWKFHRWIRDTNWF